jgi:hypothetical protein
MFKICVHPSWIAGSAVGFHSGWQPFPFKPSSDSERLLPIEGEVRRVVFVFDYR